VLKIETEVEHGDWDSCSRMMKWWLCCQSEMDHELEARELILSASHLTTNMSSYFVPAFSSGVQWVLAG
jgi:hypothetical protein